MSASTVFSFEKLARTWQKLKECKPFDQVHIQLAVKPSYLYGDCFWSC